ncbi:thioesterase [Ktedonobacteria bacterium brp13]|nr:thioesterase [Ktedonobacteria bacterium brp13]
MDDRFIQEVFAPVQPRKALLCFPVAGASAAMYRALLPWVQRADIALYAVEYPGHGTHQQDPLPPTIAALVDMLKNEVSSLLQQLPTTVLGMSLGGMVSYEVLRAIEPAPQQLVIASCSAPTQVDASVEQAGSSPQAMYRYLSKDLEVVCSLEEIESRWEWYRTVFALWRTTFIPRPGPLLPCPLTVWYGTQDRIVSDEQCRPWHEFTQATCHIEELPGPHLLIHSPYFVRALLSLLAKQKEVIAVPDAP